MYTQAQYIALLEERLMNSEQYNRTLIQEIDTLRQEIEDYKRKEYYYNEMIRVYETEKQSIRKALTPLVSRLILQKFANCILANTSGLGCLNGKHINLSHSLIDISQCLQDKKKMNKSDKEFINNIKIHFAMYHGISHNDNKSRRKFFNKLPKLCNEYGAGVHDTQLLDNTILQFADERNRDILEYLYILSETIQSFI